MDPVQDTLLRKSGSTGNRTSGSVARNSDPYSVKHRENFSLPYPLDRTVGGVQSRSLPCSGQTITCPSGEPKPGRPARRPSLYRLILQAYSKRKQSTCVSRLAFTIPYFRLQEERMTPDLSNRCRFKYKASPKLIDSKCLLCRSSY
jgi:hypothetical protein